MLKIISSFCIKQQQQQQQHNLVTLSHFVIFGVIFGFQRFWYKHAVCQYRVQDKKLLTNVLNFLIYKKSNILSDLINKIFSDLQVHPMEQLQEISSIFFLLSIGIF